MSMVFTSWVNMNVLTPKWLQPNKFTGNEGSSHDFLFVGPKFSL